MTRNDRHTWRRGFIALALLGTVACSDDDESSPAGDGDADGSADGADGAGDGGGDGAGDGAGDGSDDDAGVAMNIVETAVAAGDFTVLAKALTDTGLDDALAGPGPFTVFAPTDAAFEALGAGALDDLTTEQLAEILQYHVVSGELASGDLEAGAVQTLSGLTAFVSLEGGVKINDATVTTADVQASNGVIHVIDKVLLPPDIVQAATYAGSFTTLLQAATQAGLAGALSDPNAELTVFAPTDDAFAALPDGTLESLSDEELADILKYHVVPEVVLSSELTAGEVDTLLGPPVDIDLSSGVKVNDASVVLADVVTTNGVIHVIDAVLLPPN